MSALRLAEKGYRVAVLECGRRFEDHDFAKNTWNWRRFLDAGRVPKVRTSYSAPEPTPVPAPDTASG